MKKLIIGITLALVLAATAVPAFAANGQDPLDHVVISPDPATVAINGGTQQFTAVSQDADNDPVVGVVYVWEVVNLGGTIDATGKFTAGNTAGTYLNTVKVTASKGGITKTDFATVVVAIPGLLDHVVISPETTTIQPTSGTQQFSAVAKDAFNTNLTTGVTYLWEVVNGGGAIDAAGKFTAGAVAGTFTDTVKVTATQTATLISKNDTATVKVAVPGVLDKVVITPDKVTVIVGGTKQFTVTAKDAFNQTILTGVTFQWSFTGVGSIDQTGKYQAGLVPGAATVTVKATQVAPTTTEKIASAAITVVAEAEEHEGRVPAGWSHGKKTGWDGGSVPPGWSKGKKIGWDGKDSPPGLLKQNDDD